MVGILLLSFLDLRGVDGDGLGGSGTGTGEKGGHHDFGSLSWLFRLRLFSCSFGVNHRRRMLGRVWLGRVEMDHTYCDSCI